MKSSGRLCDPLKAARGFPFSRVHITVGKTPSFIFIFSCALYSAVQYQSHRVTRHGDFAVVQLFFVALGARRR